MATVIMGKHAGKSKVYTATFMFLIRGARGTVAPRFAAHISREPIRRMSHVATAAFEPFRPPTRVWLRS